MSIQSKRANRRSIALRAALGGLISSSLSTRELQAFAEQDLDYEFIFELRHALMTLQLSSEVESTETFPEIAFTGQLVETILDEAKRRRLTKNQVHKYMHEIDPDLASMVIHPEHTLRESLDSFVSHSHTETGNLLLSRVLGIIPQDPFLTGISKRK